MKLLYLGNSGFKANPGIEEKDLPQNRPMPEREAALGGSFERVAKIAWPTERLPEIVEGWIREEQPDAIVFLINEFWFNYRSTPAFVSRKFGPLGRPIASVGAWAGRKPRVGYSKAFQAARRFTSDKVGGDAHFEPDDVIRIVIATLRRITRHEGVVPFVLGPMGMIEEQLPPALRREGRQRRMKVHSAIKQFCEANHIEYWGVDQLPGGKLPKIEKIADGIHPTAAGLQTALDVVSPVITDFLKRVQQQQNAEKMAPLV